VEEDGPEIPTKDPLSDLEPPAANVSYRGAPSGFLLDQLATLSIKLTWSSRFFGKPIRGIPAPQRIRRG
jgi:hypothetical protein